MLRTTSALAGDAAAKTKKASSRAELGRIDPMNHQPPLETTPLYPDADRRNPRPLLASGIMLG
jgi:hypothetical protein